MSAPSADEAYMIAERLLGHRPDHLEPFQPAVGGDDSHSFRLWFGNDPLILKVKKRAGSPVGVYFHTRLRAAGIPVPDLVAFGATAGPAGEACAVWEWVDGVPAAWGPSEPCPYDEAEFGQLLRQIHDLRCDAPFGLLGDDPGRRPAQWSSHPDLGPASESWPGFFHCDRAAKRYREKGYLSAEEAAVLESLPERLRAVLGTPQRRLLHMGDIMHHGNLLVDPQTRRIVAVLDYVESMAGDPRWELAWIDYYFGQYPFHPVAFDMARFRADYGTEHDPDDAPGRFYLLAILLFEKLLFFDPASPRGRWAIETARTLLASFGR